MAKKTVATLHEGSKDGRLKGWSRLHKGYQDG